MPEATPPVPGPFLLWDCLASRHLLPHVSLCSALLSLYLTSNIYLAWASRTQGSPAHLSVYLRQDRLLLAPSTSYPRGGGLGEPWPAPYLLTQHTCRFSPCRSLRPALPVPQGRGDPCLRAAA